MNMKKPVPVESASALIDERIKELGDWRGKTLAKVREIIHEADPEIVEEWKWMGTFMIGICQGETEFSLSTLRVALTTIRSSFEASVPANLDKWRIIHLPHWNLV